MTRLDILSNFETIKVAVKYKLDGREIDYVPSDVEMLSRIEPIYEELAGWTGDLRTARTVDDLPKEARAYLDFMAEYTKTPVAIISVGPDREETIIANRNLIWGE